MPIEALKCPTCGGPVKVRDTDTLSICLYCNGALRFTRPNVGQVEVAVDPTISTEVVEQIKDLVIHGKRSEAVALYQSTAKCDAAAAEAAIDAYVASSVTKTMFSSPLNAFGMFQYVVALALIAGAVCLGVVTSISWFFPGILILLGLVHVIVFTKQALQTLRYLAASKGEATIVRYALIGKNRAEVYSYRLLIDVREASGSTFRTELPFPASASGAKKIVDGGRFKVKYFPGDPKSVVHNGTIAP